MPRAPRNTGTVPWHPFPCSNIAAFFNTFNRAVLSRIPPDLSDSTVKILAGSMPYVEIILCDLHQISPQWLI
jgi:hypothetical protein